MPQGLLEPAQPEQSLLVVEVSVQDLLQDLFHALLPQDHEPQDQLLYVQELQQLLVLVRVQVREQTLPLLPHS